MDFNPGQMNNSEYCFNFNNGLKEVLTFYKNFLFESKKDEIQLIENLTKQSDYYKYLNDYEIAKEMNKRFPIIKYLNKYKLNTEKEINKAVKEWEILEKKIKNKDISNIGKNPTSYNYEENEDINYLLNKYFRDKNNEKILLKIFKKDIIDYYKENNRYINIYNKYLK